MAWENSSNCDIFAKYCIYVNNVFVDSVEADPPYTLCNYGGVVIELPFNSSYNCYLEAVDSFGNRYSSNTIQIMPITVTAIDSGKYAVISWQSPSSQIGATWGNNFDIYKKREFESDFPPMPFATVPITQLEYTDTADVCYRTTSYQVGITNYYDANEHCEFKTAIGTVQLVDKTQPRTPVLDSVTTTENNQIALGFHAPEDYMRGYIIYYNGPAGWETIDTVYETTYWIDHDGGARCYRIAVLDSCFNSSEITTEEQCNMILSVEATDACIRTASLNWDEYVNMQDGVDYYEIFTKTDSDTAWHSAGTTTNPPFQLDSLEVNSSYRVFVRVYNTTGTVTASSNRVEFTLTYDATNDFSYIRSVSVENNQYIKITVHTSGDTLPFKSITLQRSTDGINFTNLQTLPHTTVSPTYEFIDTTADFNRQLYYYQTYVTDYCNFPVGLSNISHNILLNGEATTAHTNLLQWNNYGTWNGEVESYSINRKLETEVVFNRLPDIIMPTILNTYSDDVSELYGSGSKFIYYVEAQEGSDDYGFSDVSTSNYLTLRQNPNTYIPNAFSPLGPENRTFKPVNLFVPTDNYRFIIFSRFGNVVFKTRNPHIGWDGRIDGKLAPMGVYMYRITYNFPDGTPFEKTGSVTLIY